MKNDIICRSFTFTELIDFFPIAITFAISKGVATEYYLFSVNRVQFMLYGFKGEFLIICFCVFQDGLVIELLISKRYQIGI